MSIENEKMWIDGEWCDSSDGKTQNDYNPYTGELLAIVPSATKEDVERAIASAVEGQREWSAVRYLERENILEKFLALWQSHVEEIALINCLEGGKPITQSRTEVSSVVRIFRAYMHAGSVFCGETLPLNTDPRGYDDIAFTINEPLGVIVCIGPYNFPISLMAYKVAPALLMGNSIIMKPSSETPLGTLMMAKLLVEAGVSPKAVQCVTGSGSRLGDYFCESSQVSAFALTGSSQVGAKLMRGASEHLQHVMMELGGNDALVIFEDADLDNAAKEAFAGRIRNAGQVCMSNKRILVHESVKDEFIGKLIEHIQKVKILPPTDDASEFGCLVSEKAAKEVEEQIQMTVDAGATIVYGGGRRGAFVEPTVLSDVKPDLAIAQSMEVFGPVFTVITFKTFDEAIWIANNTEYGLSSGVMSADIKRAMKFAMQIQAGTCVINGSGNYHQFNQAFGGVKMSGIGREGAMYSLREYTRPKTVVLKRILMS